MPASPEKKKPAQRRDLETRIAKLEDQLCNKARVEMLEARLDRIFDLVTKISEELDATDNADAYFARARAERETS